MSIGTVAEITKAVEAIDYQSAHRFEVIDSVAFDTRRLGPNSLFVPLQGQTDGHDYIEQAIQSGATAVLWGRKDLTPPDGICAIWVDDPLQAFQKLAKWYLQKVSPLVVGITGSSGKTTTKDMTAAALGARYRVYKTQGNFNNDIGLPQTILDMPENTEALVLEMGMSEFHEIEFLSTLAQPNVVAITLIGESHMEQLGSKEGITKAKLEILSGLRENGTFIYPAHESLITAGIPNAVQPSHYKTITVGEGSTELSARNIQLYPDHTAFELVTPTGALPVTLPVLGAYNVSNALIAIEIALTLDVSLSDIIDALAHFELTKNRTQWVKGQHGVSILNDAYNASPIAMKSVIKSFVSVDTNGRRILVLGDIRELGERSKELHASIAEVISPSEVALVYLYGEDMSALYDALKGQFEAGALHHYMDKAALIADLKAELKEGDQVLIKSSNGTGLLAVVDALKAE